MHISRIVSYYFQNKFIVISYTYRVRHVFDTLGYFTNTYQ